MTVAEPFLDAPEQAVILLDRPGYRSANTPGSGPIALADVGGRPFLDYLLETCVRFGFSDLLLLCDAAWCDRFTNFATRAVASLRAGTRIAVERRPAAGGDLAALHQVWPRLSDRFLLLDGQSLFGFNWLDLMLGMAASPRPLVIAAQQNGEGYQSDARVCLVSRDALEALQKAEPQSRSFGSIVRSSAPANRVYDAFWIDIGVPGGLERAAVELPKWRYRPAVFFDRDGTVNVEVGYAFRPDQLEFMPGAVAAIKRVNDSGRYAFLVTNQSGIARGLYKLADMELFHATLQRRLRAVGAHLDDIRYCPDHPDGIIPEFTRESGWRKPAPGMFLDLLRRWPVIRDESLAVGDMERDVQAAQAAGIAAIQYRGGDLDTLLAQHIGGK